MLTPSNTTRCATNGGSSRKPTAAQPSPSICSKPSKTGSGNVQPGSTCKIKAVSNEYEQPKSHFALASDYHKLKMSIDGSLRRICNRAFFEKI